MVMLAPLLDAGVGFDARLRNRAIDRCSSRNWPLKLSVVPFSHGLPGSMSAISRFWPVAHFSSARETHSGPLAECSTLGAPCRLIVCVLPIHIADRGVAGPRILRWYMDRKVAPAPSRMARKSQTHRGRHPLRFHLVLEWPGKSKPFRSKFTHPQFSSGTRKQVCSCYLKSSVTPNEKDTRCATMNNLVSMGIGASR